MVCACVLFGALMDIRVSFDMYDVQGSFSSLCCFIFGNSLKELIFFFPGAVFGFRQEALVIREYEAIWKCDSIIYNQNLLGKYCDKHKFSDLFELSAFCSL